MDNGMFYIVVLGIFALLGIVTLAQAARIVNQYERD